MVRRGDSQSDVSQHFHRPSSIHSSWYGKSPSPIELTVPLRENDNKEKLAVFRMPESHAETIQQPKIKSPLRKSIACDIAKRQEEVESAKTDVDPAIHHEKDTTCSAGGNTATGYPMETKDGREENDNYYTGLLFENTNEPRQSPRVIKPKNESLIEKKKRMVLYKESLKKKFTHEAKAKAEFGIYDPKQSTDTSTRDSNGTIQAPATTHSTTYSSNRRHQKAANETRSIDVRRPKSRSRSRFGSRERISPGLPQTELTKLGATPLNEPRIASSNLLISDLAIVSGSSRHASSDDKATAAIDPVFMNVPDSSTNECGAPRLTKKTVKKDAQSETFGETNGNDVYNIMLVVPPDQQLTVGGVKPPLHQSHEDEVTEPSGTSKIEKHPHDMIVISKIKTNSEYNYASFQPILVGRGDDQADFFELPSPQDKGFNEYCGGSSLFSALTEIETAEALPRVAPNAPQKTSEHLPHLELAVSSSLFSFPSTDMGDHQHRKCRYTSNCVTLEMPHEAAKLTRAHERASFDSLCEVLEGDDTGTKLETIITSVGRHQRTRLLPCVSTGVPKTLIASREQRSRMLSSEIMSVNHPHVNDPQACEPFVRQLHDRQQIDSEGEKPKRKNRYKLTKFMPLFFRAREPDAEARNLPVDARSVVDSQQMDIVLDSNPSQDFGNGFPVIENALSEDEDSKTLTTVLDAENDNGNLPDGIEVFFNQINELEGQGSQTKSTSMTKARSSATFGLASPTILRFPSLLSRLRSAPNAEPKVDGPIYDVRVTLGYLQGVKIMKTIGKCKRKRTSALKSPIVGFAYVDKSPGVAFASSELAMSRPVAAYLNDPNSLCHIVWSRNGKTDKRSGRLYFSVVQDKADRNSTTMVSLVVGVKMGTEMLRLGTASISFGSDDVQAKHCSLRVQPHHSEQVKTANSRRFAKAKEQHFADEDNIHYQLDKNSFLRVRLDVRQGSVGLRGPAGWGDVDDDEQSFVHSLYDLKSFEETSPALESLQVRPDDFSIPDELLTSVEVVPLADGSTYISTFSVNRKRANEEKAPLTAAHNEHQQQHNLRSHPLRESWNCLDATVEDGTQSMEKDDDSMAGESIRVESETLVPPLAPSDADSRISPTRKIIPLLGVLRHRPGLSPRLRSADAPYRPAIESISEPLFRLKLPSPKARDNRKQSETNQATEPIEVERPDDTMIEDSFPVRVRSHEQQSTESLSRATSYTRSTRKSSINQQSDPLDRAANWIIDVFRGFLATTSTDSDDHERHTTFSHSTRSDGLSMHHSSGFSISMTEEASSVCYRNHRQRQSSRNPFSVEGFPSAVSGLSEASSHDSAVRVNIEKERRILAPHS